ncbi:MAG: ethanolamine utilization protein EutN [Spirochaetaceae bacterium]|nr:MAG: ethanolamine utilization protein EutN [Spirochaetaceae bacterium]
MIIARVVGSAVSTVKEGKLVGRKLLVVQKATPENELYGEPFIAVDTVGAGEGELVFVAEGSSARHTEATVDAAVDAAIVGILDSLELNHKTTFRKE